MKIKKGDNVIVIAGKDRGKTGKVVRAFPDKNTIIIDGINLKKKHRRATKNNQKGQIIDKAHPLHVSNVGIVDPKDGKRSRVGKKLVGDAYVRVAKRSGTKLDS